MEGTVACGLRMGCSGDGRPDKLNEIVIPLGGMNTRCTSIPIHWKLQSGHDYWRIVGVRWSSDCRIRVSGLFEVLNVVFESSLGLQSEPTH